MLGYRILDTNSYFVVDNLVYAVSWRANEALETQYSVNTLKNLIKIT